MYSPLLHRDGRVYLLSETHLVEISAGGNPALVGRVDLPRHVDRVPLHVESPVLSSSGKHIFVLDTTGCVTLVDAQTRKVTWRRSFFPDWVSGGVIVDGGRCYLLGGNPPALREIGVDTEVRELAAGSLAGIVSSVRELVPGRALLAVQTPAGSLRLGCMDLCSMDVDWLELSGRPPAVGARIVSGGGTIAAAGDHAVLLWSEERGSRWVDLSPAKGYVIDLCVVGGDVFGVTSDGARFGIAGDESDVWVRAAVGGGRWGGARVFGVPEAGIVVVTIAGELQLNQISGVTLKEIAVAGIRGHPANYPVVVGEQVFCSSNIRQRGAGSSVLYVAEM